MLEYGCVKQTKNTASGSNICWKNVQNNLVEVSVFIGKQYYIWIKDTNGNISDAIIYNTNKVKDKNE